jgi:DNA-binding CsgD family transcriptional regulator
VVERLTKKELRALLECIKECYPICDLETFAQRVVSRLSRIVPTAIISDNGVYPRRRRNVLATYPRAACTSSQKKIFEPCLREHPFIIHHGKRRIAPRLIKHVAVNCKTKNLAVHDQLLFKLLSPHLNQAYRNAQTITHMQQKLTLVDRALYRLNLGLIFLTPDGRIHLATTGAMQQLMTYLGPQSLRENRLPESLWRWINQQEVVRKGKDDVLLRLSPFVLEREAKRLVIRLVPDLDQNLLLLEEHPTTMQLQSLVPFGVSPREAQVLDWVAQGKTNKEIGVILDLSPRTVQKHLEHIYRKIYVKSRTAAAAKTYDVASLASNQTTFPKAFALKKAKFMLRPFGFAQDRPGQHER